VNAAHCHQHSHLRHLKEMSRGLGSPPTTDISCWTLFVRKVPEADSNFSALPGAMDSGIKATLATC
jgi:hypothetical protein